MKYSINKTYPYIKKTFISISSSAFCFILLNTLLGQAVHCHAISSANIPLDSPVYLYLDKLAGLGLITSDIKGLKPYSKAEAARLVLEAEKNAAALDTDAPEFGRELITRTRRLIPREFSQRKQPGKKSPLFDYNPVSSLRMRYVYLDGAPRDYNRTSFDSTHQSAFGFIGGDLRPLGGGGRCILPAPKVRHFWRTTTASSIHGVTAANCAGLQRAI